MEEASPVAYELPSSSKTEPATDIIAASGTGAAKKRKKKRKRKAKAAGSAEGAAEGSALAVMPAQGAEGDEDAKQSNLWNLTEKEERERIREFWLGLGDTERRNLVQLEKEAVLKKIKEQQKHMCSCSVCGKRRTVIEEELEMLYNAYYEELEQYERTNQRARLQLEQQKQDGDQKQESATEVSSETPSDVPASGSELAVAGSKEEEESVDDGSQFSFARSLTVKGGILTVADDLLKNEGKKFLEMMEKLSERKGRKDPAFGLRGDPILPLAGDYGAGRRGDGRLARLTSVGRPGAGSYPLFGDTAVGGDGACAAEVAQPLEHGHEHYDRHEQGHHEHSHAHHAHHVHPYQSHGHEHPQSIGSHRAHAAEAVAGVTAAYSDALSSYGAQFAPHPDSPYGRHYNAQHQAGKGSHLYADDLAPLEREFLDASGKEKTTEEVKSELVAALMATGPIGRPPMAQAAQSYIEELVNEPTEEGEEEDEEEEYAVFGADEYGTEEDEYSDDYEYVMPVDGEELQYDNSDDFGDLDDDDDLELTEEQRLEEGRRMFQIFAAKMFEQRVLQAYREKVALERQERLIQEAEDEERLEAEKRESVRRKNKLKREKRRQKQLEKELARQEEEEAAAKARAEEEARKAEEAKKEQERLEAERRAAAQHQAAQKQQPKKKKKKKKKKRGGKGGGSHTQEQEDPEEGVIGETLVFEDAPTKAKAKTKRKGGKAKSNGEEEQAASAAEEPKKGGESGNSVEDLLAHHLGQQVLDAHSHLAQAEQQLKAEKELENSRKLQQEQDLIQEHHLQQEQRRLQQQQQQQQRQHLQQQPQPQAFRDQAQGQGYSDPGYAKYVQNLTQLQEAPPSPGAASSYASPAYGQMGHQAIQQPHTGSQYQQFGGAPMQASSFYSPFPSNSGNMYGAPPASQEQSYGSFFGRDFAANGAAVDSYAHQQQMQQQVHQQQMQTQTQHMHGSRLAPGSDDPAMSSLIGNLLTDGDGLSAPDPYGYGRSAFQPMGQEVPSAYSGHPLESASGFADPYHQADQPANAWGVPSNASGAASVPYGQEAPSSSPWGGNLRGQGSASDATAVGWNSFASTQQPTKQAVNAFGSSIAPEDQRSASYSAWQGSAQ